MDLSSLDGMSKTELVTLVKAGGEMGKAAEYQLFILSVQGR